jgi:hypothetical protein
MRGRCVGCDYRDGSLKAPGAVGLRTVTSGVAKMAGKSAKRRELRTDLKTTQRAKTNQAGRQGGHSKVRRQAVGQHRLLDHVAKPATAYTTDDRHQATSKAAALIPLPMPTSNTWSP